MTTYNWSALANDQSIAFDPSTDVLNFDQGISAADLSIGFSTDLDTITFTVSGKVVELTGIDIKEVTTTHFTFENGSLLLIGDNDVGEAGDSGANTLTGGDGNDRILGLGGADTLSGGAGDDVFAGGFTSGALGNDSIDGGAGSDRLEYSTGAAAITANLAAHTSTSTQGTFTLTSIETVRGTNLADTFIGGDQAHVRNSLGNTVTETFRGNGGNDSITGGGGNNANNLVALSDFFTAADYANNSNGQGISANLRTGVVLDGRGGTDTLVNVDSVRGGSGNDTLLGGSLSRTGSGQFFESLRGNGGNDTLDGNNENTGGLDASTDRADYANNTAAQAINVNLATGIVLDGLGGTDTLIEIEQVFGGDGNDTFLGGDGNDTFDGGEGDDSLTGGAGNDEAHYSQSTAGVIVNLSSDAIDVEGTIVESNQADDGMGGTDTLSSMENVRGSDFDDYIRGSDDVAVRQTFQGDAGDDYIDGGDGIDFASYGAVALKLGGIEAFLENGAATINDKMGGTDTLINIDGVTGTNSGDQLTGGAGDQWFRGRGGSDVIDGGAGTGDWVSYNSDPSGITVNLATGTATDGWNGAGGVLKLRGTDTLSNIENVEGSDYADTLTGNAGANVLDGRDGNDTLNGGAGNDKLTGGGGTDTASYAAAAAGVTVKLAQTTAQNTRGAGSDTLSSIENATGSSKNDNLTGSSGKNALNGGAGNDVIKGLAAADVLTGGTGKDIFDFDAVGDSGITSATRDTIKDFKSSEGDRIDLSTIDANGSGAGNTAFKFVASFSANATGQVRFDAANHLVLVSTDADGAAELSILLTGVNSMTGSNFVL